MDNLQIPLQLTLAQVNAILVQLGKAPFADVFQLVNTIQAQSQAAMSRAQAQAQAEATAAATAAAAATPADPNAPAAVAAAAEAAAARANPPPRTKSNRAARRAAQANGADHGQPAQ